jgi:hypothetical protein
VDGREYLIAGEQQDSRSARPRIDLVQCYDESIIAYSESRDVLRTDRSQFAVPANIGGYAHVILQDGRLLGHWKVVRARNDLTVETRIREKLGDAARAALGRSVERYRRFATS